MSKEEDNILSLVPKSDEVWDHFRAVLESAEKEEKDHAADKKNLMLYKARSHFNMFTAYMESGFTEVQSIALIKGLNFEHV